MPRWVAGLSIAPINAAIIARNQPEHRVSSSREFWEEASSRLLGWPLTQDGDARRISNETSAALSTACGVLGFFDPRILTTVVMPQGAQEAVSVLRHWPASGYDQEICRIRSLKFRCDAAEHRRSARALRQFRCFDTGSQVVGPEQVMASGTLPPGFPPVEIDGEPYWGGIGLQHCPRIHALSGVAGCCHCRLMLSTNIRSGHE